MQCARWIPVLFVPAALVTAGLSEGVRSEKDAMPNGGKTITLTVKEKSTELKLAKGDTFELKLETRGGTGYTWQVAKIDDAVLKLQGKPTIEAPDKPKPGGPALQVFRFRAEAAGTCELELHYRRPFEKDKPPEKTYQLTLRVVNLTQDAQVKEPQKAVGATPTKRAESLGVKFEKLPMGYLNGCNRSGKLLFTSGFVSKTKGRLGKDLTVQQGYEAARESTVSILRAVWNTHGTLDNLRVIKVFGCVNSTPDFVDQPKVINGCSDMLHDIFGAKTDGYHARSALGFASLPGGVAVEIEAIFEIKD